MPSGSESLNFHQKMERLILEMVEQELPIKEALKEFEKIYIEIVIRNHKGNKTKAAKTLGLHRNTLHNLCRSLKIQ